MLSLKNIVKNYHVASDTVQALKGVSLNFRSSEFVSVLGPSGCGKTTLLNIIGGLDRYTSGDLIINGKSTKSYKDRDWDVYRNHRIGFIFQSYNLIPHQTVLGNVELALTIAGVSKEERVRRAKEALDRVGLKGQYKKKPNQLSGGQCQRVAIARALVNNPEILLADEPTGALDTVTSVQIMELIKEISKERLVIMVTHNPDLADKYSSRIVRMLDGEIVEDTMPFSDEEEALECQNVKKTAPIVVDKKGKKKKERAKMSFFTAFKLSARNLIAKKGRTVLVGIAGSIGIVGIALVLAFSAGIKGYVASMQDDMLSGNPITITEQTYDINALTGMMGTGDKLDVIKKPNKVSVDSIVEYFIKTGKQVDSLLIKNEIDKNYIDYIKAMPSEYFAAIKYGYGLDLHNNLFSYVQETNKENPTLMSVSAITSLYVELLKKTDSFKKYVNYVNMFIPDIAQAPNSEDYIRSQYEVYGNVATKKNEVMLVISSEDQLSDLLLARFGYYTQDEFTNLVYKADVKVENDEEIYDENYNPELDKEYFDYEELLGKKFYWYPNSKVFPTEKSYNHIADESWNSDENCVELSVVGILKPNENISFGCLSSGLYYTQALTDHVLSVNTSETGGIIDYYKNLDVSSLNNIQAMTLGSIDYNLTYNYANESEQTAKITLSLGGGVSLMSMMPNSGITIDKEDVVKSIIRTLGGNDLANSVTIYPISFDSKDLVTDYLKAWNGKDNITLNGEVLTDGDRQNIEFTDTLELVIGLINTMIDIVSYALIAFTSVSLVVSTVMIGIITYVSVVERIKEIGVIRSLGGRKKDVSYLFNAETFIIGLLAGIIGIGATYIICAIVNAILYPLINIKQIAMLPTSNAILLVCLSVILTLISGLIPAKSAANKDPVNALRTE